MRIAILGAGAIAYGAAAYLIKRGHEPILWSPSGERTRELAGGEPLVATGALEGEVPAAGGVELRRRGERRRRDLRRASGERPSRCVRRRRSAHQARTGGGDQRPSLVLRRALSRAKARRSWPGRFRSSPWEPR